MRFSEGWSKDWRNWMWQFVRKLEKSVWRYWSINMDYDYSENSQEVVTTIAMIKSMTTSARRRSSAAKSPMLPQISISTGKRGSQPKGYFATNNSSMTESSKSPSSNSWSTRGVALASIEFKRKLEKRKSKPQVDRDGTERWSITERSELREKDSQRDTVLKSIFAADGDKSNIPTVNLNPRKWSYSSRKTTHTKKAHSKSVPTTKNASYLGLPMLSVVKITPQCRPGTKANNSKWCSFLNCLITVDI